MRGKLIVLEGPNASGKSTHAQMLVERLNKAGRSAVFLQFPKHGVGFGKLVDAYLKGDFGSKDALPVEFISLLYLCDFYESKKNIEDLLSKGLIVVLSRFFSSTLVYQVALERDDKASLWQWVMNASSRLPKPDLVLFLDMPFEFSQVLLQKQNSGKLVIVDQHESDPIFQRAIYDEYCRNVIRLGWKRIVCSKKNNLLGVSEINELIWHEIVAFLNLKK